MKSLFTSYVQERDKYHNLEAQLVGMGAYNKDYNEGVLVQIKKLMNHPMLDSLQLEDMTIIITTVPLKMAIWDIGQYVITYTLKDSDPKFDRLTMPTTTDKMPTTDSSGMEFRDHPHPHVNVDRACSGNWTKMFRAFWNQDMLIGFNNAITYLTSSFDGGAPSIRVANWMAGLGYINDARIMKEHKVNKIEGGVAMTESGGHWKEVSNEQLIKWGCTGEIEQEPKEYVKYFKSVAAGAKSKTGIRGLKYQPWVDNR